MNLNEYPKVSIVIPCYNYQHYVLDTIDSCMRQDYKGPIEIVVVDDCSTDNSFEAVKGTFKEAVRLFRMPVNSGYSKAKNEGIVKSSGELIVTIDADDMLTEDSISVRAAELVRDTYLLMIHADAWVIKGDGGYDYWAKRLYKIGVSSSRKIHAQTTMVRRDIHKMYGLYDEDLRSRSDNEMWHRLREVAQIGNRMKYIQHPVAFYRKHDKSMVQYRRKNPFYNRTVTTILEDKKALRLAEGITRSNTRMLKR